MKRITILSILFTLLLAACSTKARPSEPQTQATSVPAGSYTNITVEELQKELAKEDFTFVNVHIPFEGNIAGTDVSIPYNEIEQNLDRLPADKGAKIVLYCRSGRMSEIAAEKLASLGYSNVQNLEGGMIAWEKAGFSLEGK